MSGNRRLGVLLILLALAGCATAAGKSSYTPYSHEDNSILRGGGGDGGGGGGR